MPTATTPKEDELLGQAGLGLKVWESSADLPGHSGAPLLSSTLVQTQLHVIILILHSKFPGMNESFRKFFKRQKISG